MRTVPVLEYKCDDFEIEYSGGKYNPHADEVVWFIPYLSMPDMLELMKLSETNEERAFKVLQENVAPILADVIDHWTWTSVRTNTPLGKEYNGTYYKPLTADIAGLSYQEVMYLVDAFFKSTRAKGEANPQPASLEQS